MFHHMEQSRSAEAETCNFQRFGGRTMLNCLHRYIKLIQKSSSTAVPQLKTWQYQGKDSPGIRSGSRMHRKVRSRVSFFFLLKSEVSFCTRRLNFCIFEFLFTLCWKLNKYRQPWEKLHVSVALTMQAAPNFSTAAMHVHAN